MKQEKVKKELNRQKDVTDLMMVRLRDLKSEVFKVLLLDSRNKIKDEIDIPESVSQANPIIREIMSKALQNFAASIVCVHNHPSGDPQPSQEDKTFTQELVQAGKVLQIKLLDHIIIGDNKYFSFADEGMV